MYRRRDAANFIFLLGFVVLVYIAYQTWLKPKAEEFAGLPSKPKSAGSPTYREPSLVRQIGRAHV